MRDFMRNTVAAGNNTLSIGMEYYIVRNEKILPNEGLHRWFFIDRFGRTNFTSKKEITFADQYGPIIL
jgi:hypothetical protein